MATNAELTQQVNDLTTLVNGIIDGSIKIADLTLQSPLDLSSQIPVNGNEKITIQQILDELNGLTVTTISSNYTANIDEVVLVNNLSSDITVTLPTAVGNTGRKITINNITDSVYKTIIDGNSSETINGELTKTLTNQHTSITLISNGGGWQII